MTGLALTTAAEVLAMARNTGDWQRGTGRMPVLPSREGERGFCAHPVARAQRRVARRLDAPEGIAEVERTDARGNDKGLPGVRLVWSGSEAP